MKIAVSEIGVMALTTSLNELAYWGGLTSGQRDRVLREAENKVRLLAAGHGIVTVDDKGDILYITTGDDDGNEG